MSRVDDETLTGRPLLAPARDNDRLGAARAMRRREVFELRQLGMSYREIGDALGISAQLAHQDVQAIYRQMLPPEDVEFMRARDGATLDDLELATKAKLAQGYDARLIDRLLAIQARRARLFGMDAPTEVTGTVTHTHTLAAAEQVAALRDELAERRERRSA